MVKITYLYKFNVFFISSEFEYIVFVYYLTIYKKIWSFKFWIIKNYTLCIYFIIKFIAFVNLINDDLNLLIYQMEPYSIYL